MLFRYLLFIFGFWDVMSPTNAQPPMFGRSTTQSEDSEVRLPEAAHRLCRFADGLGYPKWVKILGISPATGNSWNMNLQNLLFWGVYILRYPNWIIAISMERCKKSIEILGISTVQDVSALKSFPLVDEWLMKVRLREVPLWWHAVVMPLQFLGDNSDNSDNWYQLWL
jgi:hypothetical protein